MTLTTGDLKAIKGIVQEETKKIVQEETKKIVQEETTKIVRSELRGVINGQSAMKAELLGEVKKVNNRIDSLEKKMDEGFANVKLEFKNVTKRIDNLGLQIAHLEDDTPTVDEFDKLEKRVFTLEQKVLQAL